MSSDKALAESRVLSPRKKSRQAAALAKSPSLHSWTAEKQRSGGHRRANSHDGHNHRHNRLLQHHSQQPTSVLPPSRRVDSGEDGVEAFVASSTGKPNTPRTAVRRGLPRTPPTPSRSGDSWRYQLNRPPSLHRMSQRSLTREQSLDAMNRHPSLHRMSQRSLTREQSLDAMNRHPSLHRMSQRSLTREQSLDAMNRHPSLHRMSQRSLTQEQSFDMMSFTSQSTGAEELEFLLVASHRSSARSLNTIGSSNRFLQRTNSFQQRWHSPQRPVGSPHKSTRTAMHNSAMPPYFARSTTQSSMGNESRHFPSPRGRPVNPMALELRQQFSETTLAFSMGSSTRTVWTMQTTTTTNSEPNEIIDEIMVDSSDCLMQTVPKVADSRRGAIDTAPEDPMAKNWRPAAQNFSPYLAENSMR